MRRYFRELCHSIDGGCQGCRQPALPPADQGTLVDWWLTERVLFGWALRHAGVHCKRPGSVQVWFVLTIKAEVLPLLLLPPVPQGPLWQSLTVSTARLQ